MTKLLGGNCPFQQARTGLSPNIATRDVEHRMDLTFEEVFQLFEVQKHKIHHNMNKGFRAALRDLIKRRNGKEIRVPVSNKVGESVVRGPAVRPENSYSLAFKLHHVHFGIKISV